MAYQYTTTGTTEEKSLNKQHNIQSKESLYCSKDSSLSSPKKRRLTRDSIRKKQAAKLKVLVSFFAIMGIIVPAVFFNNLNFVFLQKFRNNNINVPKEISFLNSAESTIADSTFLDQRYIELVNTDSPKMTSPVLTEEMSNVKRKLKNLMASYPRLKPGIFVWDYETGKYVSINADKSYSAASIIKIPLLLQFFRRVDKGLVDLNDSMSTTDPYITSGSGSLQYFPLGTTLTYKRLTELMIQYSDNTASNMLLGTIGGMNELNRAIKDWGFAKTHYYEWLPDLKGKNITSPQEIAKMLYNIDNPDFFSLQSRAEIIKVMEHVKNRSLIHAGLSGNVQFLHKTGDIGPMLGDAGIVIFPDERKYINVIMVNRPWNSYQAKQFITEASEIIHNSISKKRF